MSNRASRAGQDSVPNPPTGLESISYWPTSVVSAGWVLHGRPATTWGNPSTPFALASVTKPLFSLSILVAIEEGSLSFDQPAGPPGATVAHLLSHSSGLAPEGDPSDPTALPTLAEVGRRRIYSNLGFEVLGRTLESATDMTAADYFREAVVEPLGLSVTALLGSPAHGARSSVSDLLTVAGELLAPTLVSPQTMRAATTVHLPELGGVLPGFGRQDPNPWGLGFEIRGDKSPHWTAPGGSPSTFGHFGASGTFLWIDPDRALAAAVLTDHGFGPWAAQHWPDLSSAIIAASGT